MLTLITGGSKCGKSAIAEDILSRTKGRKIYIAAMMPFGEEAERTIERHRRLRSGKGFETVEKYTDIHDLELPDGCGILIECACNLLANEMFSKGEENAAEKIMKGLDKLSKNASELILVTSQIGDDGMDYPDETEEYIRQLGLLNAAAAQKADRVIEAVYGIPVLLKGTLQ